jgi:hypothetical protein
MADRKLDGAWLVARPGGEVQAARPGRRKAFGKAAKELFLEWFAATANVRLSAEKAGVSFRTVYKHRMKDEAFAAAWDESLRQGYARLEAAMVERASSPPKLDVAGDLVAPETEAVDPTLTMALLKEYKRVLQAPGPAGASRRRGPVPRMATEQEVTVALTKRLQLFGIRIRNGDADVD